MLDLSKYENPDSWNSKSEIPVLLLQVRDLDFEILN